MKVSVTLSDLTNAQVAAVLLLLPVAKGAEYNPLCWKVTNWSHNSANLEIHNIESSTLEGIFFELKERTVVLTSNRRGREGH